MDECAKSGMETNLFLPIQTNSLSNLHTVRNLDADTLRKLMNNCTPEELLYRLKGYYLVASTQSCRNNDKLGRPIVIAFLNNEDSLQQSIKHLVMLSQEIQVCICTTTKSIYDMIQYGRLIDQKKMLELLFLEENDLSLLDRYIDSFEYICLIHDAPGKLSDLSGRQLQTEYYVIWDNLIKNIAYIFNVVDLFLNKPHLGLLFPPPLLHGNLLGNYCYRFWKKPSVHVDKVFQMACDSGECFWCKAEVFRKIMSTKRCQTQSFPDIAKDLGYLTAVIMNYEYGALQLEKLNIILRKLFLRDMEEIYYFC